MKKYHIILVCICILFSSCGTYVKYFGDKLGPTTSVDVFYSEHDVAKPFKVIGHLTDLYPGKQDVIKAQLVAYAQSIGADAIVITGSTVETNGKTGGSDVVNAEALKYTN